MKVRDIIVQEGAILDMLKYPFVKFLGPLARASIAERQAIEKLAAQWAIEIEETGKISTKATSILGPKLGKDPKVLAEIEKQAQKVAKEAKYAKDSAALGQAFSASTQEAIKWASRFGWAEPIGELAWHINEGRKKLANGEITPEQFNQGLQYHIGKCLSQLALVQVAGGAVTLGNKFLANIPLLPFGKTITTLVSTLQPAAKAAFATWLGTPGQYGGLRHIQAWYASQAVMPEDENWTSGSGIYLQTAHIARDYLGSWGKNIWDIIANKAHELSGGVIPDSPGNPRSDPTHPDNPANQQEVDIIPQGPQKGWDTRKYDSTTGQIR